MTTFWVSPDVDKWRLQREGSYRAERICATRSEAIDWGCRLAVAHAPAVVKVQDYGGTITTQFEFGRTFDQAAE